MRNACLTLVACLMAWLAAMALPGDDDRLDRALDYFQGGKFHEALLLFDQLDQEYDLNPRLRAFMAICMHFDWEYDEASKVLDEVIPLLEGFAPHERSVYYFTDADSHFQLRQFEEAIPYFERALDVCYDNEKGDIHYRLGFCHLVAENWEQARLHYQQALDYYLKYNTSEDNYPRIIQAAHVTKGCENIIMKLEAQAANQPRQEKDSKEETITSEDPPTSTTAVRAEEVDTPAIATADPSPSQKSAAKPIITEDSPMRDTIKVEVPKDIDLEDLFERQIEVK